jgi:hypothetical protein
MKNGEHRNFHIRSEDKSVLAKIVVRREFDAYLGSIIVDSEPTKIETEVFLNDNELNHTIRNLIFKASLTDFKDIKEVDEKGKKVK